MPRRSPGDAAAFLLRLHALLWRFGRDYRVVTARTLRLHGDCTALTLHCTIPALYTNLLEHGHVVMELLTQKFVLQQEVFCIRAQR